MDLSIHLENTTLYIRVAVLIKGSKGYLFEKSDKGYIYSVGGKIKLNEASLEAAKRELKEELNFETDAFELKSIFENIYSNEGKNVHEICFVYEVQEVFTGELPQEFVEVPLSDIRNFDIRPKAMADLVLSNKTGITHSIIK